MLDFDEKRINKGINKYKKIMEMINQKDPFDDEDFHKLFNVFYRIRQKSKKLCDDFYSVFKMCKYEHMDFKKAREVLNEKTGEIHPSFCSKIIATLDPNKPVWDKYVLQWMGIILKKHKSNNECIDYYSKIYQKIEGEYKKHLNDKNVREALDRFDTLVPEGKELTDIKKLDFILRSNRNDRTVSIFEYNKILDEFDEIRNKTSKIIYIKK